MKSYQTSILIISTNSGLMFKLKQSLENKGCSVDWINTKGDSLVRVQPKYFDVVVLDQANLSRVDFERVMNELPELIHIPIVLLTPAENVKDAIPDLKIEISHYLVNSWIKLEDACNKDILLNVIDQISYLTSRYN